MTKVERELVRRAERAEKRLAFLPGEKKCERCDKRAGCRIREAMVTHLRLSQAVRDYGLYLDDVLGCTLWLPDPSNQGRPTVEPEHDAEGK